MCVLRTLLMTPGNSHGGAWIDLPAREPAVGVSLIDKPQLPLLDLVEELTASHASPSQ